MLKVLVFAVLVLHVGIACSCEISEIISARDSQPNSNVTLNPMPENTLPEPTDYEVRKIAECMLDYNKALHNIPIELRVDAQVYNFFAHKKGKKYRVQAGKSTLAELKIFSDSIQEEIDDLTSSSLEFKAIQQDVALHLALTPAMCEVLSRCKIYNEDNLQSWLTSYEKRIKKLTEAKHHTDCLIATIPLEKMTTKNVWEYFKSNASTYFGDWTEVQLQSFKPIFLAHMRDFYGIE